MNLRLILRSIGTLERTEIRTASSYVRDDELLNKIFEFPSKLDVVYGTDIFFHVLELTKESLGWKIEVYLELTEKEEEEISLYLVDPQHFIEPSRAASDKNKAYLRKLAEEKTISEYYISIPEYYYVNQKLKLPKKTLSTADSVGCVLFVNAETESLLSKWDIEGWSKFNIEKLNGEILDDHYGLKISNVMPPAVLDETRKKGVSYLSIEHRDMLQNQVGGCISYYKKDITTIHDIAYTYEGYLTGEVIVSKKFKDYYEKNKMKGLKFQPVLTFETEVYSKYLDAWRILIKTIKEYTPYNEIQYKF